MWISNPGSFAGREYNIFLRTVDPDIYLNDPIYKIPDDMVPDPNGDNRDLMAETAENNVEADHP